MSRFSACAAAAAAFFLSSAAALAAAGRPDQIDTDNAILRLLNSRASGSPAEYARAAETVAAEAAQGRPLQQFVIALVSREKDAPAAARISDEKRREYLKRSSAKISAFAEKKSNPLALYLLSLEKNDIKLLKRAANGGNVQAMNACATIQLTQALSSPGLSSNDVARVLERCFGLYKGAADKDDANGFYNLGMCHMNGYGTNVDFEKAYNCFKHAAAAGHPEAMNNLGGMYRDGIFVVRDLPEAAKWFSKSAALENPYGQLNYGLAMLRGEGVEKNSKEAARLFRASAEQGNPEAMDMYGVCLFRGDGVEKNDCSAVKWYSMSAALGCADAMDNLAACHATGSGGLKKDQDQSLFWRIKARAARGDRSAMAWLATKRARTD